MDPGYFRALAEYNRWANRRLYAACTKLDAEAYLRDLGAFFGSVHGTLNHLLLGDRLWMGRFEGVDSGIRALNEQLGADFAELSEARPVEDQRIIAVVGRLTEDDLAATLRYPDLEGAPEEMPTALALAHLFNHQTHHRGQAHALLSRLGENPPPLDIFVFARERGLVVAPG